MPDFSNHDDALSQMRDYGLIVDQLLVDTARPVRCRTEDSPREKRGWYWLSCLNVSGDSLVIGAYGIYRGSDNGKQTIALSKEKRGHLTPEQLLAQKVRHREANKQAEAERRREADLASKRAAKTWAASQLDGDSEYLDRKQVGAHGVRFSETGAVIVPMCDDRNSIRGLQFILPRGHERIARTGRDKEFWPKGLQMRGTYHLIGKASGRILLLAEGYATAATLHEATGLPCAAVWSANNIMPAAQALKKKYRRAHQLICADDDWVQKCDACHKFTTVATDTCLHCGQPHKKTNAGVLNAEAAAVATDGAWIKPRFTADRPTDAKGPTDFNDLHCLESISLVAEQIEARVNELGWDEKPRQVTPVGGGGKRASLKSMITIDEAIDRYSLVYGGKATMFDHQENILVPKSDVLDILPEHGWRDMRDKKRVVRLEEVGFDPAGTDPRILCNLWGGWPTEPKAGCCDCLLELLQYLCSNEEDPASVYDWVLKWVAYPIQFPGAKMRTALVFHGGQGTGKNLFFEAIMSIYGDYGRIVDQSAIEDKFNDWASKKLFLIADEVVARTELYHVKNKLKGLVTGEWIRINPKNVMAHDERNHVNLAFLSNEAQPLVLEKDDRRYTVVHTPEKLDEKFYGQVHEEIRSGGVAALHHYLLHLDLGGFNPHTKPPLTRAKEQLINVSMDSVSAFLRAWQQGDVPGIPFCPCLGTQLFSVYKKSCEWNNEPKPRVYRQFMGDLNMQPGWLSGRPFTTLEDLNSTTRISRKMVVPPDHLLSEDWRRAEGQTQEDWLTCCYFEFAKAGKFEI